MTVAEGDTRSLRVVVVDEELPYPLTSGKRIRTVNLLLDLAKRHQVTLLCHRNSDATEVERAVEFFGEHGIETLVADYAVPAKKGVRFWFRLARNLFSRYPFSVATHMSRAMRQEVSRLNSTDRVDLWQCEWTPYAVNVLGLVYGPCLVMAHNIESVVWQRLSKHERNFAKRWYMQHQYRKYQKYERWVFSQVDRTVTVSSVDAERAKNGYGAEVVSVVDNGVDVSYFTPDDSPRDPFELLFLGSLDWRANQDGIVWLLDEVFPAVRRNEPCAKLSIVGRRPPKWLSRRAAREPRVELHADPADVRPFLRRCGAMIVPLRVAGGSRLKILEALASGCPVIATPIGAEGMDLEPGMHYLQALSAEQMESAILTVMQDPKGAARSAARGRTVVLQKHDWRCLTSKLEEVWLETVSVACGNTCNG